MNNDNFSHIDNDGKVTMVDVSSKPIVKRVAIAKGTIKCAKGTIDKLTAAQLKKGDPLATARIAAILAAKKTGDLIPLCHPLPIDQAGVEFTVNDTSVDITATVITTARTGIEMEALMAVSVAALTIYDMCKAVDKAMVIDNVRLTKKTKEIIN